MCFPLSLSNYIALYRLYNWISFRGADYFRDTEAVEAYLSPVYTTKHSNVYHKSNCHKLGIGDFIEFASSKLARNAGGVHCQDCKP